MGTRIEKRDGKLVKVPEDGTTAELSQEERDLFAAEFGARDEGSGESVADLSARLQRSEMARKTDKIEHRLEDYERRGLKPIITQRIIKPLAMLAAAEERSVEVVDLSMRDGALHETRQEVSLDRHVWNLADTMLKEFVGMGVLVDLPVERGDADGVA